jgi:hypothetical protein
MITPIHPPAVTLEPDEALFLAAFRAMDDRARSQQLRTAKRAAADWSRRTAPSLRLVVGGAA